MLTKAEPYVNTRESDPSKRSLKKFKIYTWDTPINTSLKKMSRTFDLRYKTIVLRNFGKQVDKVYANKLESPVKRLILS